MRAAELGASAWAPRALSLLRIMAGLLFLEHGLSKLVHFPIPAPAALTPEIVAAGVIEMVGGALVALGLFTRGAAFIMAGEMAVAYFWRHAPRGFYPLVNGGEAAILFCFIFVYIAAAGPGPWTLSRR